MPAVRRILVPTDFSAGARAAMRFALDLARTEQASVTLLHVYQPPEYLFLFPSIGMHRLAIVDELARDAERRLALEKKTAESDAGVPVGTASCYGSPAPEIVRSAEEGQFDLVVMGTHGRGYLAHALMGSVAEKVVRMAKSPVLTVPVR